MTGPPVRSGFDGAVRSGRGHLFGHRVVAAGIEDQDAGAHLVVERGQDRIHIDHAVGEIAAAGQPHIDRDEVVAPMIWTPWPP